MSNLKFATTFTLGESVQPASITLNDRGFFMIVGKTTENGNTRAFATQIAGLNVVWEKVFTSPFSSSLSSIDKLKDGNFIMVGTQYYGVGADEQYLWIVKMDNDGNVLWESAVNSDAMQTQGYCVSATSDGGFVVIGGIIESGNSKTIVITYDSSNKKEWQKNFEVGVADSVIQTSDGGFALSGHTNADKKIQSYVFALKLDAEGNEVWETVCKDFKNYGPVNSSIIETESGQLAIAAKAIILVVNSKGDIVYSNKFEDNLFNSIVEKDRKNFAVAGNLIISNYEHAYLGVLNKLTDTFTEDNTEIMYPSIAEQVIKDKYNNLIMCGFISKDVSEDEGFVAVF